MKIKYGGDMREINSYCNYSKHDLMFLNKYIFKSEFANVWINYSNTRVDSSVRNIF